MILGIIIGIFFLVLFIKVTMSFKLEGARQDAIFENEITKRWVESQPSTHAGIISLNTSKEAYTAESRISAN